MVKRPDIIHSVEESFKAEWLAQLSISEAFRMAEEMDRFSRTLAPEAFRFDQAAPLKDPHVLLHQRLHAAFAKVLPPSA